MKKLSLNFLFMASLLVTLFVACGEDDNPIDGIAPVIVSLAPDAGAVGDTVAITGTSFGDSPSVSFGTTSATVLSGATTTSLSVTVPTGLSAGDVEVTVTSGSETSEGSTFTVEEDTTDPPTTGGPANAGDTLSDIEAISTLAAAVDAAGIEGTLNDAERVTIFAPSNAAFDSLLNEQLGEDEEKTLENLIAAITAEGVSGILQAHVIADSLPSDLLATDEPYNTLNEGSTITITAEGENVFANGAQVITPDIIVGNGVIHIIDSVINVDASPAAEEEEGTVRVTTSEEGVGDVTWTSNNTYILDGFVYVNEGQTLTIEAGTVVKGRPGQAARASALIVAQGRYYHSRWHSR